MPRSLNKLKLAESNPQKPTNQSAPSTLQPGTPCSYSNTPTLPFSKDAAGLSTWLSTPHPEYNMASLDYYGHLIDEKGEVIGFSTMIQQQFGLPKAEPYIAEFSLCNNNTDGVVVAPFLVGKDKVAFHANPFSVTASLNVLIENENITIALVSGEMGQPGATYKLTAKAFAFDVANWEYEIELTDVMGAVAVGYGPLSFLPQWLQSDQLQSITNTFNGNVEAYLQAGKSNMEGSGSYYYSLPMLQVNKFKITVDGFPYASGTQGYLWVDYVTQSFSETSYPILKDKANWQFLAIQFPPELNQNNFSGALMFSKVEMPIPGNKGDSTLKTARFYHSGADKEPNTAMKAWHDWDIQDIKFKPNPDKLWPPKGKHQFSLEFTLTLGDPDNKENYAILKGTAVRNNQEVKLVHKYEGMYKITGSIYVKDHQLDTVTGYAWGELH